MTVIGTGFCGGFTTFSTACWQVAREIGLRRWRVGVGYAVATIVGCLAAAWLGIQLGSW
nr:CrcB family protein [Tessaracoccus coleopterorum]